jgi:hypothetical protein
MPLTRLELEEREVGRWVAEIEIGGVAAKFKALNGTSFEEIWDAVRNAYYTDRPNEKPAAGEVVREPRPHDREHGHIRAPIGSEEFNERTKEIAAEYESVPVLGEKAPVQSRKPGWPKGRPRKPAVSDEPPGDDSNL